MNHQRLMIYLLTFILISQYCLSEVTGHAYLTGKFDHSGVTVTFNPKSPTARCDSARTDASGFFRISLKGGLYQVHYTKSGYKDLSYNTGGNVLIDENYILDDVSLEPASIKYINDYAFGKWSNDTVYVLMNNVQVPQSTALEIEPGTTIKVRDYFTFEINGTLIARGTASEPILFTSARSDPKAGSWNGIIVHTSASVIERCTIEFAKDAIACNKSNPRIVSNDIRNFLFTGIDCLNGTPEIKNNYIHDFNNPDNISRGINITDASGGSIECNMIFNGSGYGIETNSYIEIANNFIHEITAGAGGGGSGRGFGILAINGRPVIRNNYLHDCSVAISFSGTGAGAQEPLIANNTLCDNSKAIEIGSNASGSIINNIVANNDMGIEQTASSSTPGEVSYNLLWNNRYGDLVNIKIDGIGKMVTTNPNGQEVDAYYNMIADPAFENNKAPILSSQSPAWSNGHPYYSGNIGLDVSVGCVYYLTDVRSEPVRVYVESRNFPNPFSHSTNIEFTVEKESFVKIEIFDMTGRVLLTPVDEFMAQGLHTVRIDMPEIQSGIYFYRIITNYGIMINKMTVVE